MFKIAYLTFIVSVAVMTLGAVSTADANSLYFQRVPAPKQPVTDSLMMLPEHSNSEMSGLTRLRWLVKRMVFIYQRHVSVVDKILLWQL
jgi:hypothetical protein